MRLLPATVVLSFTLCATGPGAADDYAEAVLDNGLRVIAIAHRANPVVASAVIVGAGVVQEPAQAAGASHFLEHLLFNGTTTRSQKQLYDEVDRIGAYNNATTREDHTLFTMLVAKEFAQQGIGIQADMLFASTIPAENFEKERKIVLEELARDRTDPDYEIEARFRSFAFGGTPLERPVLGTEASLASVSRDTVVDYYRQRYVPANTTVVVMGDFECTEMIDVVRKRFGAARPAPTPVGAPGAWPPRPESNIAIAPQEDGPSRLLAAFPLGGDPWDRTTAAAEVLLAAAAEGQDAPLSRALERRGLEVLSSRLVVEARIRPWSSVLLDLKLEGAEDPKPALDALADALRAMGPGGEGRARIDLVLARQTADAAIARDQVHYFAMLRAHEIQGAPAGFLDDASARWSDLGPADWDAASAALAAGLSTLRARFTGKGLAARSVSWAPGAPAATPPLPPLRAGSFDNGLRYVVRQSGDSGVFAMHVAFCPRAASEPPGLDGITDLLHRTMSRGTIVHGAAALEERLASIGARIKTVDDPSVPYDDYYTTPEFSWMRLEVPAARWRDAVGLAAEIVRFPALTETALDEGRRDMRELVSRRLGSPRDVAVGELDRLLAPGHASTRPVLGSESTLAAITLEALKSHHAAVATGRRTIVTVVSAVDAGEVVRALSADFGVMPAGEPPPAVPPAPLQADSRSAESRLGKSQAYLVLGRLLDVAPSDRAALTIAVAMLSDRLAFDLRETKGLAYAIGASVRPWAGRTRFEIAMGTRADNIDTARSGIVEGTRAFRAAEVTPDEVARTVTAVRRAAWMRRMTRISLAYESGLEAMRGREPGDERRFLDGLRAVGPADVKRVAAAYLDPDALAQAIAR